ncbi:MAG: hypothetical protein RMK32_10200 [Anaerolineae bacterium]|nr:hypothetical protein [Anaerolineae bacterium]
MRGSWPVADEAVYEGWSGYPVDGYAGRENPPEAARPGVRRFSTNHFAWRWEMLQEIRAFLLDEEGASLVEFALIFLFIAVVAALVLPGVRTRIQNAFNIGGQKMDEATGAASGGR